MSIKNILLIRLRLLGDIIFTIPTITLLKKNLPNCNIYYIVEDEFEEIGKLLPNIYKLIVIPRKMGLIKMLKLRKKIRSIGFDVLIDLHSGPKSSQISFLSGIKKKIGYRVPFRSWIYDIKFDRTQKEPYIHSVFNQIRLLEGIGIKTDKKNIPSYPQAQINKSNISNQLQTLLKKEKKIVLHVGAGNSFRDWGTDNYICLSKRLTEKGYSVFLIGHGKKEIERGKEIEKKVNINNLIGKLSIEESFFLIQNSDLYFGVDSGPLHLASLTETPIVAIYGPNLPEISGPWRKKNVSIVQSDLKCRPCDQRVCIYKENNDKIKCMKNIEVNDIYETIVKYSK